MNAAQKRIVVQDLYNKGMHERKVLPERANIPLSMLHRVVNQIEKDEGAERKKGIVAGGQKITLKQIKGALDNSFVSDL